MKLKIDEPAFPELGMQYIEINGQPPLSTVRPGLTKREYFAARAMQGMFSGGVIAMHKNNNGYTFDGNKKIASEKRIKQATEAVLYADALMKALEAGDVEG